MFCNNSLKMYLALSLLLVALSVSAADPDTITADVNRFAPLKRPFIMSLSVGKLMNLGGNPDAAYFGRRASVNTEVAMQLAGFFNSHIGAYGMFSICGNPWKYEWFPDPEFDNRIVVDDCGIPQGVAIQLGGIYRYEIHRWQFSARLGVGIRGMGGNEYYFYKSDSEELPNYETEYIQTSGGGASFIVSGGLVVGFRTSRIVSLILEVECRHRFGRPDRMTHKNILRGEDGSETVLKETTYKSYSFGKEMVVRLGVQFQCDLSRPGKKKK